MNVFSEDLLPVRFFAGIQNKRNSPALTSAMMIISPYAVILGCTRFRKTRISSGGNCLIYRTQLWTGLTWRTNFIASLIASKQPERLEPWWRSHEHGSPPIHFEFSFIKITSPIRRSRFVKHRIFPRLTHRNWKNQDGFFVTSKGQHCLFQTNHFTCSSCGKFTTQGREQDYIENVKHSIIWQ